MVRDQQLAIHVCPYRPGETSSFGLPAAHPVHLWPTTATHTGPKISKATPTGWRVALVQGRAHRESTGRAGNRLNRAGALNNHTPTTMRNCHDYQAKVVHLFLG